MDSKNMSLSPSSAFCVAQPGHLYVVATPIGNRTDLSLRAYHIIRSCDCIACEDTRVAKKLIHLLDQDPIFKASSLFDFKPISHLSCVSYREENERTLTPSLIQKLQLGKSIVLLSDAGTPTLSDPGFRIVRACRRENIPVIPIPGPCAAIAALSASGLPSNGFLFLGFLPPKSSGRVRAFNEYKTFNFTLIFYESCHRIQKCIQDAITTFGPERIICIAREITKLYETFLVGPARSVFEQMQSQSQKGEFVLLIAPEGFHL